MPLRAMPNETARLRRLMKNSAKRLRFTAHAVVEMKNDSFIEADIRYALNVGTVTWVETKRDLLWHVEGSNVDGQSIRVVIAANEIEMTIKIVTVMAI